jgi:hypothetical protein
MPRQFVVKFVNIGFADKPLSDSWIVKLQEWTTCYSSIFVLKVVSDKFSETLELEKYAPQERIAKYSDCFITRCQ